jgi:hypothetical protein
VEINHKHGLALRTETTINDTGDFGICKGLNNLPALREVGFSANRRLLGVQRISHDPAAGADAFAAVNNPIDVDGQHAAALRFGDPRAQALLATLHTFRLQPNGFTNADLRSHLAGLLGTDPDTWPAGRATYDLHAPRGASPYPQRSWEELEGRFLGLMAYLDAKARGNNSMPAKQRSCSGV